MVRPLVRLFAVTAVLAQIVAACDGELNPQPLPPANGENGGKQVDNPTTGSATGDNASPGSQDAGTSYQDDGGRGLDGGDAGDGG